jgi:hypothetical protein
MSRMESAGVGVKAGEGHCRLFRGVGDTGDKTCFSTMAMLAIIN